MKQYYIANFKSYLSYKESIVLLKKYRTLTRSVQKNMDIIICPSAPVLAVASDISEKSFFVGAQDSSPYDFGAFTGEVTTGLLKSMGIRYSLVGHSERRVYFHEDDRMVNDKIHALLQQSITPIICFGETASIRKKGGAKRFITQQIKNCLRNIPLNKVLLAYEPLWAISGFVGSQPASVELIGDMFKHIRVRVGGAVPLLYGGSVDPVNIKEYAVIEGLNGFLVGSASTQFSKAKKMVDF